MNVPMGVNEIGLFQQGSLKQDFRGRSRGHQAARLENKASIGNVLQDVEIVGGGDHGLSAPVQADQEIDHLTGALGIEGGSGFVEQQHLRIKNQHGSER